MNERLLKLLEKIDHDDDGYWNDDGTPNLEAVRTLWGLGKLTKKQLDECGIKRNANIAERIDDCAIQDESPVKVDDGMRVHRDKLKSADEKFRDDYRAYLNRIYGKRVNRE